MSNEYDQIVIEKIFKKIPVPYPIVSILIAIILYSIYWFFSTKVYYLPWEFIDRLVTSTLCILIALQLAGIQYTINKMGKKNFIDLLLFPKNVQIIDDLYVRLSYRFYRSNLYYVTLILVIVPFIIIQLTDIFGGAETFYTSERTVWSLLLDIYNNFVGYLMLFLLSIILWIIFNILLTFNEIFRDQYRHLIEINILSIDKIGGLGSLRNSILKFLTFYFMCITLAIITYISPDSIYSYNSYFLIILLLFGVSFFLICLGAIQKTVKGKIEYEINEINKKYQLESQKLIDIVSEENYKDKERELNLLSLTIEQLCNEKERRLQLYDKAKVYDHMTIIQFISSFIFPLIAFLQNLTPFIAYLKEFIPSGII
jgi:hypothetical protein